MKKRINKIILQLFLLLSFSLVFSANVSAADKLSELEFKDADLLDVIRIIAELSGDNIVATPAASNAKITIFLRDVEVHQAIETICRINNLWYRRDQLTSTYRIMTNEEYSKDLVIHRNDRTKVFVVRAPNVVLIAEAVNNLYGNRVVLSGSGEESKINELNSFGSLGGSGGSNSNGNSNGNSNNNSSSGRSSRTNSSSSIGGKGVMGDAINSDLSVDQLAALAISGIGRNVISAQELKLLSDQREPIYVSIAAEHNMILVRTGDEEALAGITALVDRIDVPLPQVMLEMKVMDATLGDDFSSVFNFELLDGGVTGDSSAPVIFGSNQPAGGSFIYEFFDGTFKANIEFLEDNQRINVLSTPLILAVNNRPSKLFVGDELVIVQGYEASVLATEGGDNVTIVNSSTTLSPVTSIQEVGSTIEIIPFINADNTVTLRIRQQISSIKKNASLLPVVANGEVLNLPIDSVTTATLEGTVLAKDGLTFAIGGLVRDTVSEKTSRVPGLSAIPGLGKFFSSVQDINNRTELILMITPHVMVDASQELTSSAWTENRLMEESEDKPKRLNVISSLRCGSVCRH